MKTRHLLIGLLIGSAALTGSAISAWAQENDNISGKYCEKFIHLAEALKRPNEPCEAPAFIRREDLLCVQEREAEDYLQLNLNEDGSLNFAFSLWYPPHTHYCSIIGTALPSKDGWTYQENMAADSDFSRCILNFKDEDDMIKISNDIDARCKIMCGYHTDLQYLNVPKSLKKADTPDQYAFDYGYYMALPEDGGPVCNERAKRFPDDTKIEKYVPDRPLR